MKKDLLELCINFEGKLFLNECRVHAEMIGFPKSLQLPENMAKEEANERIKQYAPEGAEGYSMERENEKGKSSDYISLRYYKNIKKS